MPESKPGSALRLALILGALALLSVIGYRVYSDRSSVALPALATIPPPEAPVSPAEPQYPLPAAASSPALPPLPSLYDSDSDFLSALGELMSGDSLLLLLVREHLIERLVASVDNLPNRRVTANILPLRPLGGSLLVESHGQEWLLSAQNGERYRGPLEALLQIDPAAVAQHYRRWYPLFQQAYRELGYQDRYFNDRLIFVIDHLLAAPEPDQPIILIASGGRYQFADADLESASVGHKLMLRLGLESSRRLKVWLADLRSLLIAPPPADAAG